MPNPLIAVAGASLGSAAMQSSAANRAASSQDAAAAAGIAEQRRQFDTVRNLLQPFVGAGTSALGGQQALAGLSGANAQQQAVQDIQNGPQFAAMTQAGEAGILANASATGGLRGGNVQAALGQFRPQVLSQLIDQQYSRLGGLSAMGQNAAAGVGTAAQNTGQAVSGLMQQQGAARAGGALASGKAWGNALGGFGSLMGQQLPTTGPLIPQGQTLFGKWGF